MCYKLVITFCVLMFTLTPPNDEVITWRDDIKLSWKNFKGDPKPDSNAVAVTASGITFEYSVKETQSRIVSFTTTIKAHFYPNKSWYIKERADNHILAHEQLHFDITELHVRKFRKEVAQLKVSPRLKNELRRLHEKINTDLATMQNLYDTESDNSINKEAQAKWQLFVKKELKALEYYKSKD